MPLYIAKNLRTATIPMLTSTMPPCLWTRFRDDPADVRDAPLTAVWLLTPALYARIIRATDRLDDRYLAGELSDVKIRLASERLERIQMAARSEFDPELIRAAIIAAASRGDGLLTDAGGEAEAEADIEAAPPARGLMRDGEDGWHPDWLRERVLGGVSQIPPLDSGEQETVA